jgi:hypothetical protein
LCIKSEDASQKKQSSGDAITSCIGDTRLSCLKSIFDGALLGKTPLFTTLFPNRSIDQSFQAACNSTLNNHMRLLRIHWCYVRKKLCTSEVALILEHRHFVSNSASGCAGIGNHITAMRSVTSCVPMESFTLFVELKFIT